MGDHIVRREPPTRPRQPSERRPTAEIPEQQLHELIHDPTQDDLEAELELVDAFPDVLPEATPDSLSIPSSPRLAHTLRRGMRSGAAPIVPPPPPPAAASARAAMPHLGRPASRPPAPPAAHPPAGLPPVGRLATATPRVPAPTVASAGAAPRLARPSRQVLAASSENAIERVVVPALTSFDAELRDTTIWEPRAVAAPSQPLVVAAAPRRPALRTAGRARVAVPIGLVVFALGVAAFWLR